MLPTYTIFRFHGKRGWLKLVHEESITTSHLSLHFSEAAVSVPTEAHVSHRDAVFQSGVTSLKPAGSLASTRPWILAGVWYL